jgi:hypothetical protein
MVIALVALVMLQLEYVAIGAAMMLVAMVIVLVVRFAAVAVSGELVMTFWRRLVSLLLVLACLTLSFGGLYRAQAREDPGSFGESALHHPLSSFDALNLAVDTLTPGSAGRIAPESEAARAEEMTQRVIDFVLLLLSPFILGRPGKAMRRGSGNGRAG